MNMHEVGLIIAGCFLLFNLTGALYALAVVSKFYPRVWRILWWNLCQTTEKPWRRRAK